MTPHSYIKRPDQTRASGGAGPWKVADLCAAYNWPRGAPGGGVIAIVELGGGWTASDLAAFAAANGLPSVPTVTDISVDGTVNTPGGDADGEVALDIEVAWASYYAATGLAPLIRIYWCSDIAAGVRAAAADGCATCSISWGADEAQWPAGTGPGSALDMEAAAQTALAAGMVVFAASGDNDSSDGGPNAVNVDCPSSCPSVVACGGTSKTTAAETRLRDLLPGPGAGRRRDVRRRAPVRGPGRGVRGQAGDELRAGAAVGEPERVRRRHERG